MREVSWSKSEKSAASRAFDEAYSRECSTITAKLNKMIGKVSEPSDIWKIHDYLSERRKDMDDKYDRRYSVILRVFSRLIHEGLLSEADLSGLAEDKIAIIRSQLKIMSG